MEKLEWAGLRVIDSSLRTDWDGGRFYKIKGLVAIEVLHNCILTDPVIRDVAELMASNVAHDTLEQRIHVEKWSLSREGSRILMSPTEANDTEEDEARYERDVFGEFASSKRPSQGW